jgi:hypothetical protein
MSAEKVIVTEVKNKVIIKSPGPQGPAGKTILNGNSAPSNNLGVTGDFYVNNTTHQFYGPKLTDTSWTDANIIQLAAEGADFAFSQSWEIAQVTGPVSNVYSVSITHNLGFFPNVTTKDSSGETVETGLEYVNANTIKLTMAQPFSGTAYLS